MSNIYYLVAYFYNNYLLILIELFIFRNFKSLASIKHTFNLLKMEGKQSNKFRYPRSMLLNYK